MDLLVATSKRAKAAKRKKLPMRARERKRPVNIVDEAGSLGEGMAGCLQHQFWLYTFLTFVFSVRSQSETTKTPHDAKQ
jgi:hypothetical protein